MYSRVLLGGALASLLLALTPAQADESYIIRIPKAGMQAEPVAPEPAPPVEEESPPEEEPAPVEPVQFGTLFHSAMTETYGPEGMWSASDLHASIEGNLIVFTANYEGYCNSGCFRSSLAFDVYLNGAYQGGDGGMKPDGAYAGTFSVSLPVLYGTYEIATPSQTVQLTVNRDEQIERNGVRILYGYDDMTAAHPWTLQ